MDEGQLGPLPARESENLGYLQRDDTARRDRCGNAFWLGLF